MMEYLNEAARSIIDYATRKPFLWHSKDNPYLLMQVTHSKDVLSNAEQIWSRKWGTEAPEALRIAAIYHDIDRFYPEGHPAALDTSIDRKDVSAHRMLRTVIHPANAAMIFSDEFRYFPNDLKEDIAYLIHRHEKGGRKDENGRNIFRPDSFTESYNLNEAASVIAESDGISFFNIMYAPYAAGRSPARVKSAIELNLEKLSLKEREKIRDRDFGPVRCKESVVNLNKIIHAALM
jgi:hypothetical protein